MMRVMTVEPQNAFVTLAGCGCESRSILEAESSATEAICEDGAEVFFSSAEVLKCEVG